MARCIQAQGPVDLSTFVVGQLDLRVLDGFQQLIHGALVHQGVRAYQNVCVSVTDIEGEACRPNTTMIKHNAKLETAPSVHMRGAWYDV
jgi:hypothetical protein